MHKDSKRAMTPLLNSIFKLMRDSVTSVRQITTKTKKPLVLELECNFLCASIADRQLVKKR